MKKMIALVLSLVFVFGLIGCQKSTEPNDFSDYEDACMAIVQFVLDYPHEPNGISSYTLDMDEGCIKIDDMYQSDGSLTPSIEKILKKGFTYIEVNEDCMIFWEDNGFYGWLWSCDPVESLKRITESDRPYMKSKKITHKWYEVRTNGSF